MVKRVLRGAISCKLKYVSVEKKKYIYGPIPHTDFRPTSIRVCKTCYLILNTLYKKEFIPL